MAQSGIPTAGWRTWASQKDEAGEQMDAGLFLFKLGREIRKLFFHHVQEFHGFIRILRNFAYLGITQT